MQRRSSLYRCIIVLLSINTLVIGLNFLPMHYLWFRVSEPFAEVTLSEDPGLSLLHVFADAAGVLMAISHSVIVRNITLD